MYCSEGKNVHLWLKQWYHRGRGQVVVVTVFQCLESKILEQACQTSPCFSLENMLAIIYVWETPFLNHDVETNTNAFPLCYSLFKPRFKAIVFVSCREGRFLKSPWSCRSSLLLSNLLGLQSSATPLHLVPVFLHDSCTILMVGVDAPCASILKRRRRFWTRTLIGQQSQVCGAHLAC